MCDDDMYDIMIKQPEERKAMAARAWILMTIILDRVRADFLMIRIGLGAAIITSDMPNSQETMGL